MLSVGALFTIERNRPFQKVILSTGEEHRLRLINFCNNWIPSRLPPRRIGNQHNTITVEYTQWVVLVSVLWRAGRIDIYKQESARATYGWGTSSLSERTWNHSSDCHGRITRLSMYRWKETEPFQLPLATLSLLSNLYELEVWNCDSILCSDDESGTENEPNQQQPPCIITIPNLERISFNDCAVDLFRNIDCKMNKPNLNWFCPCLESIEFHRCMPGMLYSTNLTEWMGSTCLPMLNEVVFRTVPGDDGLSNGSTIGQVLDLLRSLDAACRDKLRTISISGYDLGDDHLTTLLWEVIPAFPNLEGVNLFNNQINSILQTVEQLKLKLKLKLKQQQTQTQTQHHDRKTTTEDRFVLPGVASASLRWLDLRGNPVLQRMNEDPLEARAVTAFLQLIPTVDNFCVPGDGEDFVEECGGKNRLDPSIEHALRINHAGRRLLQRTGRNAAALNTSGSVAYYHSVLAPALWPEVLERAFEQSDFIGYQKNPTGLYYLIRNGPVVHQIHNRLNDDVSLSNGSSGDPPDGSTEANRRPW